MEGGIPKSASLADILVGSKYFPFVLENHYIDE